MDSLSIFIILLSLLASAFFSGMEIAFISANRLKIELDSQKGTLSGRILSRFVKNDSSFIASMLLGNNISLVIYGILTSKLLMQLVWIQNVSNYNDALSLLIQTVLSTLVILVTAEFLPKAAFQINPNQSLRLLSIPLWLVYYILYPLTLFTMGVTNGIFRIFGIKTKNAETAFSKIDLNEYVKDLSDRMDEESDLDNEMQILQNALNFSEVRCRDCMVPRTDLVALDLESSIEELKTTFIESGLSKILIYRDSIDNIIGYVHSFELFKKPNSIKEILIPISFVPEAALAQDLLKHFSKQHGNIAIVVDEFGGTSGVITIEDVLEEIFGDIEDEHDVDEILEQRLDDKTFLFSARQSIDYLNEKYELELEESSEYETLGGLVLHYLESIPQEGDVLDRDNYKLKIEEVSDRKIEVIRLTKQESNL